MKKIIVKLMAILTISLVSTIVLSSNVYAACAPTGSTSKDKVISGIGETGGNCSGQGVTDLIALTVNILSIVVGIAAVIMIVVSGLKYITSGGEAGKVSNAKNTLIYAVIGLVIATLAQLLVHFVLTQANTSITPSCPKGKHISGTSGACIPD